MITTDHPKAILELIGDGESPTRHDLCDQHGAFVSRNYLGRVWSKCPACIAIDAMARAESEVAEMQKRRDAQWLESLGRAQIPERFRDRTLASYNATTDGQRQALAFAIEYADTFERSRRTGRSALFIGAFGTGKTHLAIGIALEIMQAYGYSALFTTVLRAIRRVKGTWSRDADESETAAVAAMVYPDLLILDEIGVQFGSEAEKNILMDIINERYEALKPTIMLSNLTIEGVRSYIGERVFERMRENGGQCIVFDWESHRGQ